MFKYRNLSAMMLTDHIKDPSESESSINCFFNLFNVDEIMKAPDRGCVNVPRINCRNCKKMFDGIDDFELYDCGFAVCKKCYSDNNYDCAMICPICNEYRITINQYLDKHKLIRIHNTIVRCDRCKTDHKFKDFKNHTIECTIKTCGVCGEEYRNEHKCKLSEKRKCIQCNEYMFVSLYDLHKEFCSKPLPTIGKVYCTHCKKLFVDASHLKTCKEVKRVCVKDKNNLISCAYCDEHHLNMPMHHRTCLKFPIKCTYDNCEEIVERRLLTAHVFICKYSNSHCKLCKSTIDDSYSKHILTKCPKAIMMCPSCDFQYPRGSEHVCVNCSKKCINKLPNNHHCFLCLYHCKRGGHYAGHRCHKNFADRWGKIIDTAMIGEWFDFIVTEITQVRCVQGFVIENNESSLQFSTLSGKLHEVKKDTELILPFKALTVYGYHNNKIIQYTHGDKKYNYTIIHNPVDGSVTLHSKNFLTCTYLSINATRELRRRITSVDALIIGNIYSLRIPFDDSIDEFKHLRLAMTPKNDIIVRIIDINRCFILIKIINNVTDVFNQIYDYGIPVEHVRQFQTIDIF